MVGTNPLVFPWDFKALTTLRISSIFVMVFIVIHVFWSFLQKQESSLLANIFVSFSGFPLPRE
jgi:hypothetical protein